MADITITIPTAKIPLLKAAIAHHTGQPELSNAEASAWIKERWIAELRSLVKKYQEKEHNKLFVPDIDIGT